MTPPSKEASGQVGNIKYTIDKSIIDRKREHHNIDAIKEIEDALINYEEQGKLKNGNQSTKG